MLSYCAELAPVPMVLPVEPLPAVEPPRPIVLLAPEPDPESVLEAEPEPGGAVRSGELTKPGFVHDRFARLGQAESDARAERRNGAAMLNQTPRERPVI